MKSFFSTLFALLLLISCSSDESTGVAPPTFDINKLLRGWAYQEYIINGELYTYGHQEGCNKDLFVFRNHPGQEYQYESVLHTTDNCAVHQTYMEWEVNGSDVTLFFGDQYIGRYEIIEVTDTSLHCILHADVTGDSEIEQQEIFAIPYDPSGSL